MFKKKKYIYIYNYVHSVLWQSVSSDRSLASGNKQARPPTNLPESLQGTCHHVAALMRSVFSSHATAVLLQSRQVCTLAVSSLLSLLSELRQTSRATHKLAGVAPEHLSPCFSSHAISFQRSSSCGAAAVASVLSSGSQFPPVSLKRAVTHRKHVGETSHCGLQTCWLTTNMPGRQQTTAATSAERCSALQGLCKGMF